MRRITKRSIPVLVAAIAVGAALPGPASALTARVTITGSSAADYAFAPSVVTIPTGASVRWKWDGTAPHNVTFRTLRKPSETTAAGDYRHRFRKAGTFRYRCTIHGFKGKVVVADP